MACAISYRPKHFQLKHGRTSPSTRRRYASSEIGPILQVSIEYNLVSIYRCGAGDGHSVGRFLCAKPSRSRMALYGAFTKKCRAATKERIERGMKARCAAWFRLVLSQPRVVRAHVMLPWFRSTPGTHQRDSKARYAAWFRSKSSQPCVVRRLVVLIVIPSAWFCRAQLLVSLQRRQLMPQFGCFSKLSPNTRLQRTPLRVAQDRAFFSAGFCYNVTAINRWRRR